MIKKGLIQAFDSGTYTATVRMQGSLSAWLEGVSVARNIPPSEMVPGRACAVLFFDPKNHRDAVLVAVYS